MALDVKLYSVTPDNATGLVGNVVIFRTRRPFDRKDFEALDRALVDSKGAPRRLLCVADPGETTSTPSDETRRLSLEIVRRHEKIGLSMSIAILAAGFAGSMFRALVTGLALAIRKTASMKAHSSIDDAVAWLLREGSPQVGTPFNAEIVAAHHAIRAEMAALAPADPR